MQYGTCMPFLKCVNVYKSIEIIVKFFFSFYITVTRQSGSPWKTPPDSPENPEDNDSNLLQRFSPSKTSELPTEAGVNSRTKSKMIAALSEASDGALQERTSTPKQDPENSVYRRTDRYDYVEESANKGLSADELERPSTSKDGREVTRNSGNGEDEDGVKRSEVNYSQMEPASPTLEYMYDGDGSQPLFTE